MPNVTITNWSTTFMPNADVFAKQGSVKFTKRLGRKRPKVEIDRSIIDEAKAKIKEGRYFRVRKLIDAISPHVGPRNKEFYLLKAAKVFNEHLYRQVGSELLQESPEIFNAEEGMELRCLVATTTTNFLSVPTHTDLDKGNPRKPFGTIMHSPTKGMVEEPVLTIGKLGENWQDLVSPDGYLLLGKFIERYTPIEQDSAEYPIHGMVECDISHEVPHVNYADDRSIDIDRKVHRLLGVPDYSCGTNWYIFSYLNPTIEMQNEQKAIEFFQDK